MNFIIADTFTASLARLTGEEQKAVKTTAFDLQMNPANPGMSFHKLGKAKDKDFWSIRVNADIRLIVHKTPDSLLACYVDHHDKAYAWAERRKLETHPKTGAAQWVEIQETIKEVVVPVYRHEERAVQPTPPLFANTPEEDLLAYGVPPDWLEQVRKVNADGLLALSDHLPAEAAEALLELATGGSPRPAVAVITAAQVPPETSPFEHPDAQRRFRVMTSVEELKQALDAPWDKWTVFLHPEQREMVERSYAGPARVSGSAGTGKTVVALHRAVYLARHHGGARVLLTTFSDTLAHALHGKLKRLIGEEPRLAERIEVYSFRSLGLRLFKSRRAATQLATREEIRDIVRAASQAVPDHKFTLLFLLSEWEQIVDAWQLDSWEAYRNVARLGRKTRLPEKQRSQLWTIFERVRASLSERSLVTEASMFAELTATSQGARNPPFDHVVVDEAQDISVAQLRFFAALGGDRPDALFFAGDLGQRIFQQPFSWISLGVDIRGRSRTLRVNYRTSHQIRQQADRLLGPEITDVDGNTESRKETVSAFNGPPPGIRVFPNEDEEIAAVAEWMGECSKAGVLPHEFGILVRSTAQLTRAQAAAKAAGLEHKVLDERVETNTGHVSIGTMHLAKGLEFRAVAAMACDDEVVPLQERISTAGEDSDLQEIYDTERHLLYVACTRARDRLLITGVEPASEFLDDLRGSKH